MGFAQSRNTKQSTENDSWKATGFINMYLPNSGGGRSKIGALTMKADPDNSNNHAMIIAALEGNDPDVLASFKDKLIIEYKSATPDPKSKIIL